MPIHPTPCRAASLFGTAIAATLACSPAQALLDTQLVASGFNSPVYATAPLADGRTFVVEKGGTIKVVQGGATSTFLSFGVASSGEQGLLGLAFDPGYADSASPGYRRFFVHYIDPSNNDSVIASWRTSANPSLADPTSRVEVMRWDQPNGVTNHKAGWIGFKPGNANHLFIGTGDGGGSNDPLNSGQTTNTLLGKILRIDINGDAFPADGNRNYAIPADNPFVGVAGYSPEIYALGLRNPWRASFDRSNGNFWIADVGQGQREEVDFIAAAGAGGQNFGWRVREGDIATPGVGGADSPAFTGPLLVYSHAIGSSITGGYVVRDAASELFGRYVFGDYINGRIWSILGDGSAQTIGGALELTAVLDAGAGGAIGNVASFGEGAQGQLLIVDYGGKVLQVVQAVPEPHTSAMLAAGMAVIGARIRTNRRRS